MLFWLSWLDLSDEFYSSCRVTNHPGLLGTEEILRTLDVGLDVFSARTREVLGKLGGGSHSTAVIPNICI